MGMYDTLRFTCPSCNNMTSVQSKIDLCELKDYGLNDAPLLLIADINDEGKQGKLFCENCNTKLELTVDFITRVKAVDESNNKDERRKV